MIQPCQRETDTDNAKQEKKNQICGNYEHPLPLPNEAASTPRSRTTAANVCGTTVCQVLHRSTATGKNASSGALLPRIPPQITQLLCLSPNSKISVSLRKHDGDRKAIPSSLRQCPCTYSPCMGSVKRLCANCMRTGCTKRRRVTAAANVWLTA